MSNDAVPAPKPPGEKIMLVLADDTDTEGVDELGGAVLTRRPRRRLPARAGSKPGKPKSGRKS